MLNLTKPLLRSNFTSTIMLTSQYMRQHNQCSKRSKVPPNIQRLQKLFQQKNDLPVFLKGGSTDKMLYYSTLGLAGFGLLSTLVFLAGYIID